MSLNWAIEFFKKTFHILKRRGRGISILIPFKNTDDHNERARNFKWLKRYWKKQLPGAEIIIGEDHCHHKPFSKSAAVNDAASKATGDIFVIVDADGYIEAESVIECAKQIRHAIKHGRRRWYIPYRHFFRLTKEATNLVLKSSPKYPFKFSEPPYDKYILNTSGSGLGHWYGAVIQIVPREAFEIVGGWDVRFRGWGGEDHAAMRATDTLYWPHQTLPGQVLHMWHPMFSPKGKDDWVSWENRIWEKQTSSRTNDFLANRYTKAHGDYKRMRDLVNESIDFED